MVLDDKEGTLGLHPPPYEPAQTSRRRRLMPRYRRGRLIIALAVVFLSITAFFHSTLFVSWAVVPNHMQQGGKIFLQGLSKCHESQHPGQQVYTDSKERTNPRWNPKVGQQTAIVLKNATLFDGESTQPDPVDILFERGIIRSVSASSELNTFPSNTEVIDLQGKFVTPGLVDMHSHHGLIPFPALRSTRDENEMPLLGPITTFVRSIDGFKPYDPAIKIIASGGVTSSLILPGSGNIIGGEAYMVKNLQLPGENAEPVVEELLLDHGLPKASQRYLKMACGENPKGIYGHTRMGLVWLLRQHLDKARQLREQQDSWCQSASEIDSRSWFRARKISHFLRSFGNRPEKFELDTAISLIRGELNVNVHCYEPEDFERMLAVLHEFGVHPQAFHHALDAWKVPELLKRLEALVCH